MCVIFFLFIFLWEAKTQNINRVSLRIDEFEIKDESIGFQFRVDNNSSMAFTVYKPVLNHTYWDILKIWMESKETGVRHEALPCTMFHHLCSITLSRRNTIYLNSGESFVKKFNVKIHEFSPRLNRGNYVFYVQVLPKRCFL